MSRESTDDIIAARGPAIKIPASIGYIFFIASIGIILSPTSIPGSTAIPITPTKCIPSISRPTNEVPIIIALCIALLSLNPIHRTSVTGSPNTPIPTSIQKDNIKGFDTAPPPSGVRREQLVSRTFFMMFSMPPPLFRIITNKSPVARSMTIPCMASVIVTARNPPKVV